MEAQTHQPQPGQQEQGQEKEKLEAVITLRLTVRERNQLREDAEIAGITVSELVRRRYFGRPIVAKADIAIIRELRRLGGLLKKVHTDSQGAYSQKTSYVLDQIAEYIDAVSKI